MRIIIFISFMIGFYSCNNDPSTQKTSAKPMDSISILQNPKYSIDVFFNNPIRNIDNFDIKLDYPTLDSLNDNFRKANHFETISKKNLCGGDCCTSYLKKYDPQSKASFSFFKTDCGEYGFSNSQFFFLDSVLRMVRNYEFGIEVWPTDTNETIWIMEENIFIFEPGKVMVKSRKNSASRIQISLLRIWLLTKILAILIH